MKNSLRPSRADPTRLFYAAMLVAGIAVLADLSFRLRPTDYYGGGTDDQRYLETALSWLIHGPHAGTTHWSLRHPLILAIVTSFKTFGISVASLQLVPRVFADVLVAITSGFLLRVAGMRATLLWVAIALTSPILHEMATSCFPEMIELTFGALSMWLFWEARGGGRWSGALQLGAGLALAAAALTRETAVCLIALYGYAWARGHVRPIGAIWFAAGFLPLIALDSFWMWSQTGDLLYRLHVDQSHTGIFSEHLRGGTYHGRVFFNPDLASRWLPNGPIKLHWAIDPLLNFFADPSFGLVFAAWAILSLAPPTRPATGSIAARAMPALLAVALLSYFVVTWALTLRPQPRYYLFAVYVATIAVALLGSQALEHVRSRRLRTALIGAVLLCGTITISLAPDRQRDARALLPWLQQHPDTIVHLRREEAARIAFPAALAGLQHRISGAAPPVGGIRVRVKLRPGNPLAVDKDPAAWKRLGVITQPWQFPYIHRPRELIIDQRLR